MSPRYNVVDLFSGMGGLSLGLSFTGRLQTRLAWDCFAEALDTFATIHRQGQCAFLRDDIRQETEVRLMDALAKVGVNPGQVDVVVGGPPCEGFSQNRSINSGGDWRVGGGTRVNKFIEDPRNQLFRSFLDVVMLLKPKVLLIENVPAIVKHKDGGTLTEILQTLKSMNYLARAQVLNAADYGVPQLRRRAFILAQRVEDFEDSGRLIALPTATHQVYPLPSEELDNNQEWLPGDSGYWTSVREAIGDLPAPQRNTQLPLEPYPYPANSEFRRYLRGTLSSGPAHHIARTMGGGGLSRVQALKPRQSANDLPETLKPRSFFHYSYSRLVWADPARTITKFAYNVGSGMFAHPDEDRAITMREAARLQTFPDWVNFKSNAIRDVSAMIGNAIPPVLAWKIGKEIVRYLDWIAVSGSVSTGKALRTDAVLRRLEGQSWSSQDIGRQSKIPFLNEAGLVDAADLLDEEEGVDG